MLTKITTAHIHTAAIATTLLIACSEGHAGELHLLGLVPYAYANDASDDGSVVVGYDPASYWYWTLATGVVQLPNTIGPGNGVGGQGCITADGTTMTCSTLNVDTMKAEATLYHIDTGEYQLLGSFGFHCDIERSGGWGMSNDGQHVVGLAWDVGCAARGFEWNAATNAITNLGTAYFYKPTRANAVSDSGGVIAGWNDDYNGFRQGAVWIKNAEGVFIETVLAAPGSIKMREADVVSGNGQWVYGIGKTTFANNAPWRWSVATGVEAITPTPSSDTGYVVAANYDGSRVLCFFGLMGGSGAYMWTAANGYVSLADLAQQAGVVIPDGWIMNVPLGMSEDGLTIVGKATGPDGTSPFVLDLRPSGPPCPADSNGDGMVDGVDLTAVLSGWGSCTFGGDCPADFNSDGVVDGLDMSFVLSGWGVCP